MKKAILLLFAALVAPLCALADEVSVDLSEVTDSYYVICDDNTYTFTNSTDSVAVGIHVYSGSPTVILDNVFISRADTCAFRVQSSGDVTIKYKGENTLNYRGTLTGAALGPAMVFNGTGTATVTAEDDAVLNIYGSSQSALYVKFSSVTFNGGTINMVNSATATRYAINLGAATGGTSLIFNNSTLSVEPTNSMAVYFPANTSLTLNNCVSYFSSSAQYIINGAGTVNIAGGSCGLYSTSSAETKYSIYSTSGTLNITDGATVYSNLETSVSTTSVADDCNTNYEASLADIQALVLGEEVEDDSALQELYESYSTQFTSLTSKVYYAYNDAAESYEESGEDIPQTITDNKNYIISVINAYKAELEEALAAGEIDEDYFDAAVQAVKDLISAYKSSPTTDLQATDSGLSDEELEDLYYSLYSQINNIISKLYYIREDWQDEETGDWSNETVKANYTYLMGLLSDLASELKEAYAAKDIDEEYFQNLIDEYSALYSAFRSSPTTDLQATSSEDEGESEGDEDESFEGADEDGTIWVNLSNLTATYVIYDTDETKTYRFYNSSEASAYGIKVWSEANIILDNATITKTADSGDPAFYTSVNGTVNITYIGENNLSYEGTAVGAAIAPAMYVMNSTVNVTADDDEAVLNLYSKTQACLNTNTLANVTFNGGTINMTSEATGAARYAINLANASSSNTSLTVNDATLIVNTASPAALYLANERCEVKLVNSLTYLATSAQYVVNNYGTVTVDGGKLGLYTSSTSSSAYSVYNANSNASLVVENEGAIWASKEVSDLTSIDNSSATSEEILEWLFSESSEEDESEQGDSTGIEALSNSPVSGAVYNLAGQRVATMGKGLYIVNGKKVLVK